MRVIETDDYRIEYFDETVYTAEQTIVRVIDKHSGVQAPYKSVALKPDLDTTLATYIFADKMVEIDLTEWMRLHANDLIKSVILVLDTGASSTLTWESVGLYDVSKIVRKQSIVTNSLTAVDNNSLTMSHAMLSSANYGGNIVTLMEDSQSVNVTAQYAIGYQEIEPSTDGIYSIPLRNSRQYPRKWYRLESITIASDDDDVKIPIREALCGRTYALVRWLFPTGGTVQHLIEVRDVTDTTAESYSLRTIDGSFATHKGAGQSFKLHLDELTAYDAWYYGTIATSSSVEVSFDNGETWQRVDVATKKLTQPNGDDGKLAKLNIDVTYSKHSAL